MLSRPSFFILCLALLLTACGFHLQDYCNGSLPFHTLSIETNTPYSSFTKALRSTLLTLKVDTTHCGSKAPHLYILSERFHQATTSLGANGQTTSYLLIYTLFFQVTDGTGHIVLPAQSIRSTRSFSINSNQLAGDLNTKNYFRESMQRDIIQQLLRRLNSPEIRRACYEHYRITTSCN